MSGSRAYRVGRPWSSRRRVRFAGTLLALLAGLAVVVAGGALLPPGAESVRPARVALVGRTSTVCPGSEGTAATSTVTAVAVRQAPGREGVLTATRVGRPEPDLTLTEQGKGQRLESPAQPVVLRGVGVMATAAVGAVFGAGESGATAGLVSAPCTPPSSTQWFVGIGTDPENRSDLELTNPDDSQAVVDLRFYGPRGIVVVPGSPAVVVEANSTRRIGLQPLIAAEGPMTVAVRASEGRVAAKAFDQRSSASTPAGADWHSASTPPRRTTVIPAVPEGDGERQLVISNPGRARASVVVEVLGLQGAFAPVGSELVEVPPESTVATDLRTGLAGGSGTVRLSSDRPVTGAVIAGSARSGAQPDVTVLAATAPLVRAGAAALATVDGVDSELVVSNAGDDEARVSVEVLSDEGVTLRTDDIVLVAGGTSTRRLTSPPPSYLVVRVPDGSAIHGGVVFDQPEGEVAGLTVLPLTSPDVASRAPTVRADPGVAR